MLSVYLSTSHREGQRVILYIYNIILYIIYIALSTAWQACTPRVYDPPESAPAHARVGGREYAGSAAPHAHTRPACARIPHARPTSAAPHAHVHVTSRFGVLGCGACNLRMCTQVCVARRARTVPDGLALPRSGLRGEPTAPHACEACETCNTHAPYIGVCLPACVMYNV